MQPLILLHNVELKIIILSLFFLILFTNNSLANTYEPKVAINGSGSPNQEWCL